ncbi:MAG: Flagella protein [Parcubacteria bacterium 32_520]|nr:MAG: Flagella protein [Parcubacteria bacterium 32_520]
MALEDITIKDFLKEEEEEEKFEWTPARKSVAERFGYTPPATTIPEGETEIPEATEKPKEIISLPELNNKIIQEYKALQTLKTKIDNADITLAGIPDEIKPSILYQYNQDKKQYDALNNSLNAHIIQRDIMNLPTENLGVLTYSPATMNLLNSALTPKEEKFTRYIKESAIKDDWDAFRLSAVNYIHKSKQFFNSTLPNAVYKEITPEEAQRYYPEFSPQMIEEINRIGEEKKKTYQEKYNKAEENYQKWIEDNPELAPRPEWEGSALENIKRNPKLLLDPGYWGYVVAQSAAFTMGVMGTTLVGTALTGNPLLGMASGLAVAYPAQAQDLYEELIANGATPEDAAQLAVPVGALIAAVEVMGDLPILASVSAPFKGLLRQNVIKEVGKGVGQSLAIKGFKTFATIEGAETLEEIIQEAMQNAAVKTVDENRSILENIPEVAVQTLMATTPLALLGVGGEINTETKIINRNLKIGYEQVKKITEMEAFAKEEEKEKPKVEPKPPEIELRKEAEKVKEEKPPEEAEIIPSKAEPLPPEIELKEKAETEIKKKRINRKPKKLL